VAGLMDNERHQDAYRLRWLKLVPALALRMKEQSKKEPLQLQRTNVRTTLAILSSISDLLLCLLGV
jgi:hypothetical protein